MPDSLGPELAYLSTDPQEPGSCSRPNPYSHSETHAVARNADASPNTATRPRTYASP